jgi:hypothetical protein
MGLFQLNIYIVTCRGAWLMAFGLDDCIYWHLIHTTRDYRQCSTAAISTHFTLHRYTRTSVLSLHKSHPGNGFITISLSFQIRHGVFFSQPNSFLPIILQLPVPKTRLISIPLFPGSYPGRLTSCNSTVRFTLCCWTVPYNHFARTTQKIASIVKKAFLLVRCLAIVVLLLLALVAAGMCLPSSCLAMGLYVTTCISHSFGVCYMPSHITLF